MCAQDPERKKKYYRVKRCTDQPEKWDNFKEMIYYRLFGASSTGIKSNVKTLMRVDEDIECEVQGSP